MYLDDVDVPEDPILGGSPVGDVVSDGVAPGWDAAVGAEEVAGVAFELDLEPVADGLPLEGGIVKGTGSGSLNDLLAGGTEEEGLAGSCEEAAVAAPEAEGATAIDELDVPAGGVVGAVTALYHALLVLPGHQVLAVVAPQAHGLRPVEQLHQLNSNTGKEWLGLEGRRRRSEDKGFLRTTERQRLGFFGTVIDFGRRREDTAPRERQLWFTAPFFACFSSLSLEMTVAAMRVTSCYTYLSYY